MTAAGPPISVGPYSPVRVAGEMIFCSGQLPVDPATGAVVEGGIERQTIAALSNLEEVLRSVHCSLADIVRTTVYLHRLEDFDAMNAKYAERLGDVRPARSTIGGVDLPKGALIEIDAIAVLDREGGAVQKSHHSTGR